MLQKGRKTKIILAIALIIFFLAALIPFKNITDSTLKKLSGSFYASESLLEDKEAYTGYLALDISRLGSFSIYDAEAGNPGIKGFLIRTDKDKLLLICTNFADFDPPAGWEDMNMIETVYFKTDSSDNSLSLKYENDPNSATIKFFQED